MFGQKKKEEQEIDLEKLKELKYALNHVDEIEKDQKKEEKEEKKEENLFESTGDKPKKKHLFKTTDRELMGKYLFRELPLFKYEIMLYGIMGITAVFFYMLDRTFIPGILGKAVIPAVILPIGVWVIKWWAYMPRKNRVPSIRLYRSGVVEFGVEDITKGYVCYGKGENEKRKYITNMNKHREASTGKPLIITSEVHGENLNILDESKPDMRSEEFNAILETERAVTTKNVMRRMMKFSQPTLSNPLIILNVIILALLAILVAKSMGYLGV